MTQPPDPEPRKDDGAGRAPERRDPVDEAEDESFPASDPPESYRVD